MVAGAVSAPSEALMHYTHTARGWHKFKDREPRIDVEATIEVLGDVDDLETRTKSVMTMELFMRQNYPAWNKANTLPEGSTVITTRLATPEEIAA